MRGRGFRLLACIAAVVLGLFLAGIVSAATFNDPQGRYSFTIPDGWQAGSVPTGTNVPPALAPGGIFTAPAPLVGNVNVVTIAAPPGSALDQIVTQVRTTVAQSLPGFQQGAANLLNAKLGGQPALQYDYFIAQQGGRLHGTQVIALQNNAVYIVTITAAENDYDTVVKQAQIVLDSFKFGAAPTTGTATTGTTAAGTATSGTTTTTGTVRPGGTSPGAAGTGGATIIPATGTPQGQGQSGALAILLAGTAALALGFVLRFRARLR